MKNIVVFFCASFICCSVYIEKIYTTRSNNRESSSKAKAYCYDLPIFHVSCSVVYDGMQFFMVSNFISHVLMEFCLLFNVIDYFFGNFSAVSLSNFGNQQLASEPFSPIKWLSKHAILLTTFFSSCCKRNKNIIKVWKTNSSLLLFSCSGCFLFAFRWVSEET